jgi:hypothetical protein
MRGQFRSISFWKISAQVDECQPGDKLSGLARMRKIIPSQLIACSMAWTSSQK